MYREATMEFNNVLLEKEGNIAIVTINRPKALNALNSASKSSVGAGRILLHLYHLSQPQILHSPQPLHQ